MMPNTSLEALSAVIIGAFPELSGASFVLHDGGWDCRAVEVGGRLIFKFPRHLAATEALAIEARLLAVIRPAVTMPVPDMIFHPGPSPFSRHVKIPGEYLLADQYKTLPAEARQRLAADMALFFAELHRLDAEIMAEAGARPIKPWLPPDEILRRAWSLLPTGLRAWAERVIAASRDLPPDPHGETYGFFDGHGWNMAFDHAGGRLNGLYDFGDSGFGQLHQEFVYPNWIAQDLTERIVAEYETLTGRALDRRRIALLSGVLRLHELAEAADDPAAAGKALQVVVAWRHTADSPT